MKIKINPVWAAEDGSGADLHPSDDSAVLAAIMTGGKDEKAQEAKATDKQTDNPEPKVKPVSRESVDELEEAEEPTLQDEEGESDSAETEEEIEEADGDSEAEETEEVEASGEEDEDENYDDYIVEVVVDGEAMEVSLKDLKQNFSANKYIEQNIQRAVEHRKSAERAEQQLNQVYQQQYDQLMKLSQMLDNLAEPEDTVDWERLKLEDPATYLVKREEQREIYARKQAIQQEAESKRQQQAQLQAEAMQRLIQSEAQELASKLPEMKDPKLAAKLKEKFVSVAGEYGYTPQEVGTVVDHRALLVLRDAIKWRDYQANKEKVLKSGKDDAYKKVRMKSTSKSSGQQSSKRLADKLRAKARQTGRVEDVAATLLVKK